MTSIRTTRRNDFRTARCVEMGTGGYCLRRIRPLRMVYMDKAQKDTAARPNAVPTAPLNTLIALKPQPSKPVPNMEIISVPRPAPTTASA